MIIQDLIRYWCIGSWFRLGFWFQIRLGFCLHFVISFEGYAFKFLQGYFVQLFIGFIICLFLFNCFYDCWNYFFSLFFLFSFLSEIIFLRLYLIINLFFNDLEIFLNPITNLRVLKQLLFYVISSILAKCNRYVDCLFFNLKLCFFILNFGKFRNIFVIKLSNYDIVSLILF